MAKKAGWTAAKKVLFGIGCVLAVLGFCTYQWWQTLNADPIITIPTPTMPSPNAYDYDLKACAAMVNQKQVDDALMGAPRGMGGSPPPGMMGGPMMGGPPGMMGGPPGKGAGPDLPVAPTYTLAQKVTLVKANAPALKLLHQGFAYTYQEPPRSPFAFFPHYAEFRQMARLLAFVAATKAAQGDWNGAINSRLDCICLGRDIPRGGALISMLVGDAVQAIGEKGIGNVIDHLNVQQARTATRRMEEILARRESYAEMLQNEKWVGVKERLEIFHNPQWRGTLMPMILGGNDDDSTNSSEENGARNRMQRAQQVLRMYFVNKREVLANYMRYMGQEIAKARQPYAAHLPDPAVPDDPVNEVMIVPFSDIRKREVEEESRNAQLLLTLALRAYRMEQGHYPGKLSELVPAYLHQLPDDPTALQGTFGYQRSQDTYLLFSNSSVNQNTVGGQTQPVP